MFVLCRRRPHDRFGAAVATAAAAGLLVAVASAQDHNRNQNGLGPYGQDSSWVRRQQDYEDANGVASALFWTIIVVLSVALLAALCSCAWYTPPKSDKAYASAAPQQQPRVVRLVPVSSGKGKGKGAGRAADDDDGSREQQQYEVVELP